MENSLNEWLLKASEEHGHLSSDIERIVAVGSYLFQDDSDTESYSQLSVSEICAELSSVTGYVIDESKSIEILIEALLIYAISDQSPDRGHFLTQIMEFSGSVQSDLMNAIQGNLARHNLQEILFAQEEDKSMEECSDEKCLEMQPAQVLACSDCEKKARELERLHGELDSLVRAHTEQEKKMRSELAQITNSLVNADLEKVDLEEKVSESKTIIADLKKDIVEMQKEQQRLEISSKDLMALRDEIDILRPMAERSESYQSQLERLREKCDELGDVKQQLKIAQAAHNETISKLSVAERELDQLQKMKKQVDEYRSELTESKIKIDELTSSLRQKEQHLDELLSTNGNLSGCQKSQVLQTQQLAEALRDANERLREIERTNGVGESISELNPVLMQELENLRAEKKSLLEKLDMTSLESLENLEKSLADQKAMTSSLQQKWTGTKDSLANAMSTIAFLNSTQKELMESMEMSLSECDSLKSKHFLNESMQIQLHETQVHEMELLHSEKLQRASMEIETQLGVIEEKEEEVTKLRYENKNLLSSLDETQINFNILAAKHDVYQSETVEIIAGMKRKHEEEISSAREQHETRVRDLQTKYEEEVNAEIQRSRAIQSDFEEEKLKRRKVEREKKFHETEAHRYKSQLQVAGGNSNGSGGDVDSALKELKSMQQQLDLANTELQELKQGAAMASNASNRDGSGGALQGPARGRGIKQSAERAERADKTNTAFYGGLIDQSEIVDKRIEQLSKEKRELIAKSLEGNKEKMELSQKLIQAEKEVTSLKTKLTKVTLDKERLERKITLGVEKSKIVTQDSENIPPNLSSSAF